jgi:3-oxochol-4-en-24-oyl-CoA dehydrogenase
VSKSHLSEPGDDVARLLAHTARDFLRNRERPHDAFNAHAWREMAAMGWAGVLAPESVGGSGLGLTHATALGEELGASLAPEPFIASAVMVGSLLSSLPESAAAAELGKALVSGADAPILAWQESLGSIEVTTQTTIDAHDALSGEKLFVAYCAGAQRLIVPARRDQTPVLALVVCRDKGLGQRVRTLADGASVTDFRFKSIRGAIVLDEGLQTLAAVQDAVDQAVLVQAAYLTGIARATLDRTLDHLRTRVQFGRPLGAFQVLQHRCADLYVAQALSRAAYVEAASLWDSDRTNPGARAAISSANARAAKTAIATANAAIQMHGGLGFAEETGLGSALRIARLHASWLGTQDLHLERFATLTEVLDA